MANACGNRCWRRRVPRSATLVADDERSLLGVCHVGPDRDADDSVRHGCGEVALIYVLPEAQGRGVGRALLDEACDAMLDLGFTEARLWVLADNAPAIAFYERMGWRADGAAKQEEIGGQVIEECRYWRSLA
ncbi:MAG: GNAT family N-acetyltransferase [Thermomicrobiales bacterium]